MNQQGKKLDMNKFHENLQNCAAQIKNVCNTISAVQPFSAINGDHNNHYFAVKQLAVQSDALSNYYNIMESITRELPSQTPTDYSSATLPLSMYSSFIQDADLNSENTEFFNEATDAVDYLSYLQAYSSAVHDQLYSFVPKFPSRYEIHIPLSSSPNNRPQKAFDEYFVTWINKMNIRQQAAKNFRLNYKFLEQRVAHSLIEFVIEAKSFIKALLLVNKGQVEYINLYGHQEKYTYLDGKEKVIDVFAPSKFEMYSSLSSFVNNQLQIFLQKNRRAENEYLELDFIFLVVQKANQAITLSCKYCKKHLRNGVPPLYIDLRQKIVMHEECRGFPVAPSQ